jgi:hypothetical protein
MYFRTKLLFWSLIIQRVQNADFGISHHSIDNLTPKKEHLMKIGISCNAGGTALEIGHFSCAEGLN